MTIQSFLEHAVAQSIEHSSNVVLNTEKTKMAILIRIQNTKYGIISGLDILKSGKVTPGPVNQSDVHALRQNIACSIRNFETFIPYLSDCDVDAMKAELYRLNKELIETIRSFITNKEVLK